MKKIIFGILVSLLMITGVFVSATVVETEPEIMINEFDDGEIVTSIPVGGYEIESTEQGDYITVEDFGRYLVPGKPNLPSKICAIAIPPGAELEDVTFETGEGIVLPGVYNVAPTPLPRVIGEEDPEVRAEEEQVYNENYENTYYNDESYPASIVEFVRTAGFRKYNLVDVRVNPFSYKPLSGKLTYYPDIEVKVSYTFPEGYNPENIMIDNIASFEQRAGEFILNHEVAKDWYPTGKGGRETYDYVIITTEDLETSVEDLVDWEEAKGKSVNVVTVEWINSNFGGWDLAEKMRNFLIEKYPSEEWGIEYVCLIGSYDDVPIRRVAQSTGYGQPETDFYHAELSYPDSQSWDQNSNHQYCENSDNIDFYAEVYVGRIPWSDADTVESICAKTIAYEQTDDPSFKKNILLIGTYFWPDTDNAVLMEAKVDQDWMTDWTMTRMYEEDQSSYPCDYDANYNNVKNVWSQGTFAFVDWAGHGSPTACYEYYPSQAFVDTDTCNYLNDEYPAIVFADACSNSDTDEDNIGQMMLEQGAIGFLGATKVAYGMPGWNNPYSGSSQSLDYFFTIGCTSGDYTQGESHQLALQEMYENSLWYYQKYEHCQWGALWGNPDITMAEVVTSDAPYNPQKPDGPNEWIPLVECELSTSTTDPNGDQVYYMWDWGDGTISEWFGPYNSGETAYASHAWDEIGTYEVKVKAKDEYNAQSDWSNPYNFPIVENIPPSFPTIAGPTSGKIGQTLEYTVSSTDPHGQDVYYDIIWGNGGSGYQGPYPSGEEQVFDHVYSASGYFTIKVKAKDSTGAESDEAEFKVLITKSKAVTNPLLLRFLEILMNRFPFLEKLLA